VHKPLLHCYIQVPQDFNYLVARIEHNELIALDFTARPPLSAAETIDGLPRDLQQWFDHYFSGKHPGQSPPYRLIGTDFQQQVWTALTNIPYGETRSYGEIARAISRPTAVRAVATAVGNNPLPILIPCHRVIYQTGKIGNYSGGVSKKKALLALESQNKLDI